MKELYRTTHCEFMQTLSFVNFVTAATHVSPKRSIAEQQSSRSSTALQPVSRRTRPARRRCTRPVFSIKRVKRGARSVWTRTPTAHLPCSGWAGSVLEEGLVQVSPNQYRRPAFSDTRLETAEALDEKAGNFVGQARRPGRPRNGAAEPHLTDVRILEPVATSLPLPSSYVSKPTCAPVGWPMH